MEVKIGFSMLGRMFMLPASVVDEYLKISSGDFIKVLLCIYCLGKENADTAELAAMAGVSEQTVKEAIIHFCKLGVISSSGLTGAKMSAAAKPEQSPAQVQTQHTDELKLIGGAEPIKGSKRDLAKMSRVRLSPKEIGAKIESDPELKALIENMQTLLAKGLTHSAAGDVIEMYEHMELSPASILMIAEYCKSRDKRSTAYILKVAQEWFDEGITDFDQIEKKIISLTEYGSFENKIKRVLDIQGNTTKKQREFFTHWQQLGFDEDMIRLAYEENMDRKNKYTLAYMNSILEGWAQKGISTPFEVSREQERFKQAQADRSNRGPDLTEFEDFADSIDFTKLTT